MGVSSDRIDSNSSKSNMKSIKADKENKEKSVSKREREKTCPDRRRYLMQIPIKEIMSGANDDEEPCHKTSTCKTVRSNSPIRPMPGPRMVIFPD